MCARTNELGAQAEREAARQEAAQARAHRRCVAIKARAAWPGITPEGRERLRAAALERRPWEKSTGPRTKAGKARSRKNALKYGGRASTLLPACVVEFKRATAARRRGELLIPSRRARRGMGLILRGDRHPRWLADYAASVIIDMVNEIERQEGRLLRIIREESAHG